MKTSLFCVASVIALLENCSRILLMFMRRILKQNFAGKACCTAWGGLKDGCVKFKVYEGLISKY